MKTIMTLKDTCEFYNGTGFPMAYQGKTAGTYPFYKVGDISKNVQLGNSHLKECDNYVDDETLNKLRGVIVPANSIAFAKIGEALKLNRRTITSRPCLVDNNVIAIHPNEEILDVEYFYYFMKTVNMADYSSSTTVPSVKKSSLEKICVPIPELNEQKRISNELNTLSCAIQSKKDELSSLDELVKSRFIEMFENKDFPLSTIGNTCVLKSGTTFSKELEQSFGDILYIKVSDMNLIGNEKYITTSKTFVSKYIAGKTIIPANSVIFPKRGGAIGTNKKRINQCEICIDLNTMAVTPKTELNIQYLYQYFLNIDMGTLYNGSSVPQINNKDIEPLTIIMPPIELQNEFAEFVKLIDKSKFIVQQQIKDLQELLDSKMDEYFR